MPAVRSGALLEESRYPVQNFKFDTLGALTQMWEQPALNKIRIGVVYAAARMSPGMLERDREAGELDVEVLHRELIEGALGIYAEEVRERNT